MSIIFVIRGQFISYSLFEFAQILRIPSEGQCSFKDEWSLDALSREQYSSGPYLTELPTPEDTRAFSWCATTAQTKERIGVKIARHSTSFSSAFDHGSSSRQVDNDENRGDEGTSRSITPSPTTYYNSLPQNVPQIVSNPPPHEQNMENLSARQTLMMNQQEKMHKQHQGGLKLIQKAFKKLWNKKKK
ncbi:hypothetical protein Tco_0053589 [Tanacetum coccineum]